MGRCEKQSLALEMVLCVKSMIHTHIMSPCVQREHQVKTLLTFEQPNWLTGGATVGS